MQPGACCNILARTITAFETAIPDDASQQHMLHWPVFMSGETAPLTAHADACARELACVVCKLILKLCRQHRGLPGGLLIYCRLWQWRSCSLRGLGCSLGLVLGGCRHPGELLQQGLRPLAESFLFRGRIIEVLILFLFLIACKTVLYILDLPCGIPVEG